MNQEVIDALKYRAQEIIHKVIAPELGGDWSGYAWQEGLDVVIVDNGIVFKRPSNPDYAQIKFLDLTPTNITKKVIHEPVLLGNDVTDVQSSILRNESTSTDLTRTYAFDVEETTSYDKDVNAAIEVGLRNQIKVGGDVYGASAEIELSMKITTEFNQSWGQSSKTSRETTTTVVVPPRSEGVLTTKRANKAFEQRLEYWSGLEHSIEVYSHEDYTHRWSSVSALLEALSGFGPVNLPLARRHFGKPFPNPELIKGKFNLYYDETFRFNKAVSGDVQLIVKSIDD